MQIRTSSTTDCSLSLAFDSAHEIYEMYEMKCVKYMKCKLNWPLPIRAFQDQYKQTMTNKYSSGHNKVKNPSWQEADQLAIYKRSREVELGATETNIS